MTTDPRRRRRATWIAAGVGAVTAVLVPVAVWVGARAITTSDSAVLVSSEPVLVIPDTPLAVMAVTDDDGALVSITGVAVAPEAIGGTVMSIPVSAQVPGSSDGVGSTLADVYGADGDAGLEDALLDLFHARISAFGRLDPIGVAVTLNPRGTPVGQSLVAALTDPELAQGVGAPWEALGQAWRDVLSGPVEIVIAPDAPPWHVMFAAVLSGDVSYHQFVATPVADGAASSLDPAEVAVVMASVAPGSVLAVRPGVTVQVDTGFDFAVTTRAVERLVMMEANIQLLRQVDAEAPPDTRVSSWLPLSPDDIAAFTEAFGSVEFVEPTQRVEGIDVTIVVGRSFVDHVAVPSS